MIEITEYKDGVSIKGHAGYAPHGQDIVCAAISALTQTFIMSVEQLAGDEIKYVLMAGNTDIWLKKDLSETTNVLFKSFLIGCNAVANAYPNNIQVTKR